jgi:hypothetical protein
LKKKKEREKFRSDQATAQLHAAKLKQFIRKMESFIFLRRSLAALLSMKKC